MQQMINNNNNINDIETIMQNSKFINYDNINNMPQIMERLKYGRESKICYLDLL